MKVSRYPGFAADMSMFTLTLTYTRGAARRTTPCPFG